MLLGDAEEGTTASLTWLANKNVTPWPRVLSSWKETSKRRIKELQKPVVEPEPESASSKQKNKKKKKSSDAKVTSYTETYPQITEPLGWTLVSGFLLLSIKSSILFNIYKKLSLNQ